MLAFNSAGIIGRLPRSAFAGGSSGEAGSEPIAPEEVAAIGQFRPALATAGIVVVDEQVPGESGDPEHGG
jgi:hypothetical protein